MRASGALMPRAEMPLAKTKMARQTAKDADADAARAQRMRARDVTQTAHAQASVRQLLLFFARAQHNASTSTPPPARHPVRHACHQPCRHAEPPCRYGIPA